MSYDAIIKNQHCSGDATVDFNKDRFDLVETRGERSLWHHKSCANYFVIETPDRRIDVFGGWKAKAWFNAMRAN